MTLETTPSSSNSRQRLRRILIGSGLAVGALVAGILAPPHPVAEASGGYYMLYCRGGNTTSASTKVVTRAGSRRSTLSVKFDRGSSSATVNNRLNLSRLPAGSCAWGDRGMNVGETPTLRPDVAAQEPADTALASQLIACSADPQCVVLVRAKRVIGGMEVATDRGIVFYRTP